MVAESKNKLISQQISYVIIRYVMLIIIVSFIPMFINSAFILYRFNNSYRIKVQAHLAELVLKHKQNIDAFLKEKLSDIRYLSVIYTFEDLQDELFLQDKLAKLRQEYDPVFVDLGVIRADGRQVAYAGPFMLGQANYADAEWFIKALENQYLISDVFLGLRGVPHFIITVRSIWQDRPWILRATIDFVVFSNLVEQFQVGETGFAFILNKKGELQTTLLQEINLDKDFYGSLFTPQSMKDKKVNVFKSKDKKGREHIYVSALLKDGDWLLVYQQHASDAFIDLRNTLIMNLIIILVTIMAIVTISVILSRKIVRRIARVTKEREMMSEKIIETAKLVTVGELASGVAHEINNPVAIMVEEAGWIGDLLEEEEFKDSENLDEFNRAVKQIATQGKRCKEITHKLLSFARKTDTQQVKVQINDLIQESASLSYQRARYSKVTINTNLHAGLPLVKLSSSEFQQVFLNLINNALDAMEDKGGMLDINSKYDGYHIIITIRDTGVGIPKAILPRIFNPFFTTKPAGKGTGLGLSICYGIIKKNGGEIEVESERGVGTLFTIRLPLPEKRDKI